jgi:hypothetical protein
MHQNGLLKYQGQLNANCFPMCQYKKEHVDPEGIKRFLLGMTVS